MSFANVCPAQGMQGCTSEARLQFIYLLPQSLPSPCHLGCGGKVIQLPLVTRFVQPGAGAPAAGRTQSRSWEELLKEASRGPMQFLLQEAFRERPLPFPGSDPQTERTISGSSQDRDSALQVWSPERCPPEWRAGHQATACGYRGQERRTL